MAFKTVHVPLSARVPYPFAPSDMMTVLLPTRSPKTCFMSFFSAVARFTATDSAFPSRSTPAYTHSFDRPRFSAVLPGFPPKIQRELRAFQAFKNVRLIRLTHALKPCRFLVQGSTEFCAAC
jgi:hypothetical protein